MHDNSGGDGHHHVIHLKGNLSLDNVITVARAEPGALPQVVIDPDTRQAMQSTRAKLEALIPHKVMYGINTGCGSNRNRIIPPNDILRYQRKYICTHAVGFGQPLAREIVRAMMILRVNSFTKNNSAVTLELCDSILELLNRDITPVIPEFGSVGASGDLVPLAHLGAVLIGLDFAEVFYQGQRRNAREVYRELGMTHHVLQAKEAMGLTNGATFILANAVLGVVDALELLHIANLAAAFHAEAVRGEMNAFDERIHDARGHSGQMQVARDLRKLLEGSQRVAAAAQACDFPHEKKKGPNKGPRVQDAYSLRCTPQSHGAILDAFLHLCDIVTAEVNASTDNPLVFHEENGDLTVLSGGNFHGDPLAIPIDAAVTAVAKLGSISNARLYRLLNSDWSFGLPADLSGSDEEDDTGFMIAQYAVASRVMANQGLAGAAFSSLNVPTSAQQEDYISNGANSAWALRKSLGNLRSILTVEILTGCQAVDLGTKHLGPNTALGYGTQKGYDFVRQHVAMMHADRALYPDIQAVRRIIASGALAKAIQN